jgi:ABC-type transporter Mla MlaB component
MLRITKISGNGTTVTLKLEGQIVSDWVRELERECRVALAQGRRVHLDFAHVTFVDEPGCALLRNLVCDELDIVHCPALIRSFLDDRM